jgi:hypothetical protein
LQAKFIKTTKALSCHATAILVLATASTLLLAFVILPELLSHRSTSLLALVRSLFHYLPHTDTSKNDVMFTSFKTL